MNKKLIFILIMLLVPINIYASSWMAHRPSEVTFTTHMPEPFGIVTVTAKSSNDPYKINFLKLTIHGKDIIFPTSAYSKIVYPEMMKIQLHYNPGDKTKLYLYIEYWPGLDDSEELNHVRFIIKDDKLVGRIFDEVAKPGVRHIRYEIYNKSTRTWEMKPLANMK